MCATQISSVEAESLIHLQHGVNQAFVRGDETK